MAKELSISGYVRASAETEAGKGRSMVAYIPMGVYLRPHVLNIKIESKAEIMAKELSVSGYVRASAD